MNDQLVGVEELGGVLGDCAQGLRGQGEEYEARVGDCFVEFLAELDACWLWGIVSEGQWKGIGRAGPQPNVLSSAGEDCS